MSDHIAWMRLDELLVEFRPGSGDWSWDDEATLLRGYGPYQSALEEHLSKNGFGDPQTGVLLGNDGRIWDGHHRIVAAVRLGIEWVPVEIDEEDT